MYAGIDELLNNTKPHDNVIILRDFNPIVGEGREGEEVGDFGLDKRNERGERLVEFCRENGYNEHQISKSHKKNIYMEIAKRYCPLPIRLCISKNPF